MTLRSLIAIALLLWQACQPQDRDPMEQQANELLQESSPYLLQHAYNPVEWHAWNQDNLAQAAKLGKPLLISIGYSSCHWCHVMEHECFEDDEVAAYMNEHFYCIKVDREERPDVDELYMSAANLITGRGGWPLNCFAFPDGSPFHAGTYYPKDRWLRVLQQVIDQYTDNQTALRGYADKLLTGIRLQESAITDVTPSPVDGELVDQMIQVWQQKFDPQDGGMRGAPKFPLPVSYPLLMWQAERSMDPTLDAHVRLSLDKMALGGIYDQIGGGFARYSTDPYWKVPHFEKMLYDNAQLLEVYSMAYQRYGSPLYLGVIEGIVAWLDREMKDESGLYYAALDADSEGEEGRYYIWTLEELEKVLGQDMEAAKRHFDLSARSHWEHGNYVLQRQEGSWEASEEWKRIRIQLLEHRTKREAPGLDHKCLSSWNGLLISGFCAAYRATGEPGYLQRALTIAKAVEDHLMEDGKIWHTYTSGQAGIEAMLEDLAYLGWGMLQLYECSGQIVHFQRAQQLAEEAIEHFYQSTNGLFYAHQDNELPIRTVDLYDNVTPSTQAVAFRLVYRLGLLLGKPGWINMTEQTISRIQHGMKDFPGGHAYWAQVHLDLSSDLKEVVITGPQAEAWAHELQQKEHYGYFVVFSSSPMSVPFLKDRVMEGRTRAYICRHGVCQAPTESLEELTNALESDD